MCSNRKEGLTLLFFFLIVFSMQIEISIAKDAYYMDSKEDCGFIGVQDVARSQTISIYAKAAMGSSSSQGGCTINFRAADSDAKLKIDFASFSINTCDVALYLYGDASSNRNAFRCGENPSNYFAIGRSLTITLQKTKIEATPYNFELKLSPVRDFVNISQQESNPASTGMIIGIVGGVFGILIIVGFCGVCYFRKHRANSSRGMLISVHSEKNNGDDDELLNKSVSVLVTDDNKHTSASPSSKKKLLVASASDSGDENSDSNSLDGKQNLYDSGKESSFDSRSKDNKTSFSTDASNFQNEKQRIIGWRPEESKANVAILALPPYCAAEPLKKNAGDFGGNRNISVTEKSVDVSVKPKSTFSESKFKDSCDTAERDVKERVTKNSSTSSFEKLGVAPSLPSSSNENMSRPVLPTVPKSPKGKKPKIPPISHQQCTSPLSSEELALIENGHVQNGDCNINVLLDNSASSSSDIMPNRSTDQSSNFKKSTNSTHLLKPDRNKHGKKQNQSLSSSIDSAPKASPRPAKDTKPPQDARNGCDRIAYTYGQMLDRATPNKSQKDRVIAGGKRDPNESFDKVGTARYNKRGGRKSPRLGKSSGKGFSHRRGRSMENLAARPPSPTSSFGSMEDLESMPPMKRTSSKSSLYSSRSSLYDRRGHNRKGSFTCSVASSSYIRDDLSLRHNSREYDESDEDSNGYLKLLSRRDKERMFRSENDLVCKMHENATQTLRETATQTGPDGSVIFQKAQLVKRKRKSKNVSCSGTQTGIKTAMKERTKSMEQLDKVEKAPKTIKKRSKSSSALSVEAEDFEKDSFPKPKPRPAPRKFSSFDNQLDSNAKNIANPNANLNNLQFQGLTLPQQSHMQQGYQMVCPPMYPGQGMPSGQYLFPMQGPQAGYAAYPATMPTQQATVIAKGNGSQPMLGQVQPRRSNWEVLCEMTGGDFSDTGSVASSVFTNNPSTALGYGLPPAGNQVFYGSKPIFYVPQQYVQDQPGGNVKNVKNSPVGKQNEIQNDNIRKQSSWDSLKQMTTSQTAMSGDGKKANLQNESVV